MTRLLATPKRGMYALVLKRIPRFDTQGNYIDHEAALSPKVVGSVRKGGLEIREPATTVDGRRVPGRLISALGFLGPDDPAIVQWPRHEWGDYVTMPLRCLSDAELATEVRALLRGGNTKRTGEVLEPSEGDSQP